MASRPTGATDHAATYPTSARVGAGNPCLRRGLLQASLKTWLKPDKELPSVAVVRVVVGPVEVPLLEAR